MSYDLVPPRTFTRTPESMDTVSFALDYDGAPTTAAVECTLTVAPAKPAADATWVPAVPQDDPDYPLGVTVGPAAKSPDLAHDGVATYWLFAHASASPEEPERLVAEIRVIG